MFYIPESYNTNITHQILDYKINILRSQRKNTNSKVDLSSKTGFNSSSSRFLIYKNKYHLVAGN